MANKRDIDLSAQLLGLERTLEDDILDLMDSWVSDKVSSISKDIVSDSKGYKDRTELVNFIRDIVFQVLQEVFGSELVSRGGDGKRFREQLFFQLEKNGFVRDCPTCYFNTIRLGKVKSDYTKIK